MPEPRLPRAHGVVTGRRALLGMAAGAVALGACTPGGDAGGAPSPTLPADDDDTAVVAAATAAIVAQLALVRRSLAGFPELATDMAPLRRLHRAHLEALGGDRAADAPTTATAASAQEARRRVMRTERRLQRALADASVEAGSGSLARLLASMSAAVAQHLAVLS